MQYLKSDAFEDVRTFDNNDNKLQGSNSTNMSNNLKELEEAVSEVKKSDNVEVFFTSDKKLLKEYYDLRHDSYQNDNGWKEYNGAENDFDRSGHAVVAVKNGKVIGGVRVMFSDQCKFLSNELPGTQFTYRKLIEKYDKRENLLYLEVSAVVVEKSNRDSSITEKMFDQVLKKAVEYGCDYIFGVAIAVVCRDYRRVLKRLNFYLDIVINYPWKQNKSYNFMSMFPIYIDMSHKIQST